MLLLQHSSTPVGIDRLLAFLLLEKFSPTAVIDSSRMLIHALWLFAKSDIALLIGANLPKAV
ncbi:hypothetical protein COS70_00255 [Candidatus Micrarchaeota archaeon CG06_land_8_20_14_3_00_50_6]|nr:MAG: hypothetical protein COS70_00255 [Candidatus Micrarchaeota archaeon CG06_land_8_20_14_3_00_50_6]